MYGPAKDRIARAFQKLVEGSPGNRRVNVATLCRIVDINRKTFYKHFDDTSDLACYIFRRGVLDMLEKDVFKGAKLVYPDSKLHDKYASMPFYVEFDEPNRASFQEKYYKRLGEMLQRDRAYYARLFKNTCYLDFFGYLISLYTPAIHGDIEKMLDGRVMPEPALQFLAEYHTMGIFGRVLYHYGYTGGYMLQDELEPFWSYAHSTLKRTIESMVGDGSDSVFDLEKSKQALTAYQRMIE